jgi:hypothetical protein
MRKIANGVWTLTLNPLNFEPPQGFERLERLEQAPFYGGHTTKRARVCICLRLLVNCCILSPELLSDRSMYIVQDLTPKLPARAFNVPGSMSDRRSSRSDRSTAALRSSRQRIRLTWRLAENVCLSFYPFFRTSPFCLGRHRHRANSRW